ncbi:hypothetical protein NLX85_13910 [Micromonospora sp. A3M-1-15]|uniref:sigma factor n=1 Tax=Micromonospora sp. A3M-1-15 TaxID=2962035 RepID=UPI0020B84D33|nr:sigma factor [Micromonospora sp. A3M-1-15]MCP3784466.1 hypothetical protein [Micromonospora sp. A3M-1-15]
MPDASDQEYIEYVTARLPALRRLAYGLCGDRDQADDLVQETATRLYLRWARIAEVEQLDAYVRTVLVRHFLDTRRRGDDGRVLGGKLESDDQVRPVRWTCR